MNESDGLQKFVGLYRLLEKPIFSGFNFSTECQPSNDILVLLEELWPFHGVCITVTQGSSKACSEEHAFPKLQCNLLTNIEVEVFSGKIPVFDDFESWIGMSDFLSRGELKEPFYIVQEDVYTGDTPLHSKLDKINKISKSIELLSKIADYHDEKNKSQPLRLVFVVPDVKDKVFHPVVLETKVECGVLECEELNLSILHDIVSGIEAKASHSKERLATFRVALAQVLTKNESDQSDFLYLINNWDDLESEFEKSWESYVSGFSFSKVSNELAEEQLKFSQKISDAVSSVGTKLFSVPVSLLPVALLERLENPSYIVLAFYFFASALLTFILVQALDLQFKSLVGIQKSYRLALSNSVDLNNVTPRVKKLYGDIKSELDNSIEVVEGKLNIFSVLAWLPSVLSFLYIVHKLTNN